MKRSTVNKTQFRSLAKTLLLVQLRGRTGKSKYGRLLSIASTYAIASTYLGYSLTEAFYEPAFLLIAFSVVLYISGFSFISSYPLILLDERDRNILQPFPINRSTLSSARVANLMVYIVYISTPFVIPISIFYGVSTGSVAGFALLSICLLFAAVWATLFFLLLTMRLLQQSAQYHVLLSILQMVLVFGLLIFYQAMPRYFINSISWEALYTSEYTYAAPPFWFIGMFWSFIGGPFDLNLPVMVLLVATTTIILLVLVGKSWSVLLESPHETVSLKRLPFMRWYDSIALRFIHPAPIRAGYCMYSAIGFRERTYRLQILPMALMPIAAAAYGVYSGELSSPFPQILTGWYSKMHIPVLVFYLFIARHSEHIVMFSPVPNAQWFLHTIQRSALHDFCLGVRYAIITRLLAPIAFLLTCIFMVTMPAVEAVLQGSFIFFAGLFQSAAFRVITKGVPFSEDANQLEAFHRVTQLFIVIPFLIVFWMLHYFASVSHLSFSIMLVMLAAGTLLLSSRARKGTLVMPAW